MLKSTFTALLPNRTPQEEIMWMGFNKGGSVVYGHGYYDARKKVKIYHASIFGSMHEVAALDFEKPELDWTVGKFYAKRQELIWMHYLENKAIKTTIFNVEVGVLKRYDKEVSDVVGNGEFISAIDDALIFLSPINGIAFRLYEIELNQVDETFSFNLLTTVSHNLSVHLFFTSVVYYREKLVLFDPYDNKFKNVICYAFDNSQWYSNVAVRVTFARRKIDNVYKKVHFDGNAFYMVSIGRKIQALKFDPVALTWDEAFTAACIPQEMERPIGRSAPFPLVSVNGGTAFSFRQSMQITETLASVEFVVHREKKMELKEMCLRVLWPYVRKMSPESKCLTDHAICERLLLNSVLGMELYFGKKFI